MQRPRSNSRRMTLGSMNNVNQGGNRRKSAVGLTPSHGEGSSPIAKARPPRGRASMIPRVGRENMIPSTPNSNAKPSADPHSSSRPRNSVGGDRRQSMAAPSAPAKVDPRPISDKGYQQECIRDLLNYLVNSGYEYPISHKSLARPSGKDFTNIVTFMLRRVDTNFQDGTMKIEDEVAMNFKAMGYPFTVSKTALVAAGSPHTWPSLLAALTWLMERLQTIETSEPEDDEPGKFESLEELEQKTDKAFFKYLGQAYAAFLRGDEQLTEQLENGLADRFERDDGIIEQEIEQVTDQNSIILERINNLTMGEEEIQAYTKKRDDYATDLEQFHDLIRQMEQHVETLSQKKKEHQQELAETNRTLERSTKHVEELKIAISSQALSLEDVQKLQNELKGVEESIDRAIKLKDERRKALWDSQAEAEKFWNEVEGVVSDYNSDVAELSLLPLVSVKGVEMKVIVDKASVLENDMTKLLNVDLSGSVQPALLECKQAYSEKLSEAKWRYQEYLDRLEESEEAFSEAMEKLKIMQEKMAKCDDTLVGEREAQEAKLAVRLREVESMETKVASLRDPVALEEQIARYERQCAELEALRIKYHEENVARKRAVCEEIEQTCLAIQDYDDFCAKKVAEVNQYRIKKKETYGTLNLPTNASA